MQVKIVEKEHILKYDYQININYVTEKRLNCGFCCASEYVAIQRKSVLIIRL
jgi:hypothetical protein